MRRCHLRRLCGLIAALVLVTPAVADPPGPTTDEQFIEAHQRVRSAEVRVRYSPYYTYPDETEFFTTTYRVVFDRPTQRLRVERPGYTLVCDGTDILLVADQIPGHHLRVPLNGPLTYEQLVAAAPDLNNPIPPALILLLADPPLAWLSGGDAEQATPFAPKHAEDPPRLHLRLPVQGGAADLAYDAQTLLLDEFLMYAHSKTLAGSGLDDQRFVYEFDWVTVDQPIDDAEFKLDLTNSNQTTSMAQLLSTPVAQPGGPGGGAPAGGGGGTLIGLTLPDMDLSPLGGDGAVNLSQLDEGVVIVEFFARWTRPSVLDLPVLDAFQAWCNEEGHDVTVYTVAVGEKSKAMREYMDALETQVGRELALPVLLDDTMDAAMALKLPTVPRTLVVVDGRIVEVFGGIKPQFMDDLKAGLPDWLEQIEPDQNED